jgi:ribosomal-protein-alanine N-acetyltransferase
MTLVNQKVVEMVCRPMTRADIPEVLVIDRVSFPIPWSERSYHFELTENPSAHLWVAERATPGGTAILGYIGYWHIIDEAHISTFAVHPDWRQQGVGTTLLMTALRDALRQGAEIATLEVRESNHVAVELYQRYGFRIVGRRSRYYRDNQEDALLMTLDDIGAQIVTVQGGAR